MKRLHSKNSIFLMEIILNVLLFSVLLTVGLQFFIRAHVKTRETSQLHQAVTSCESAAAVFQSGDGSFTSLLQTYHYSANLDDHIRIYLDRNFESCPKKAAVYTITVAFDDAVSEDGLSAAVFTCSTISGEKLYRLKAYNYVQRTAESLTKEAVLWQTTS